LNINKEGCNDYSILICACNLTLKGVTFVFVSFIFHPFRVL
jgi:hypothetical protein